VETKITCGRVCEADVGVGCVVGIFVRPGGVKVGWGVDGVALGKGVSDGLFRFSAMRQDLALPGRHLGIGSDHP
jgi:hypothetical protein